MLVVKSATRSDTRKVYEALLPSCTAAIDQDLCLIVEGKNNDYLVTRVTYHRLIAEVGALYYLRETYTRQEFRRILMHPYGLHSRNFLKQATMTLWRTI